MGIEIDIIFVCAFYLELAPEWKTTFTRKDREPIFRPLKRPFPRSSLSCAPLEQERVRLSKELLNRLVLLLPLLMHMDGFATVAMLCLIHKGQPKPKALQRKGINLLTNRCRLQSSRNRSMFEV